MVARALLCTTVVALLFISATPQPLEVVRLTPKTFEHETQAATGQTTGHWCVLFTNSSASSSLQVAAEDAWEHLAEDEDKATIMAKVSNSDIAVDVSDSDSLLKRFNISSTPAAILFRDRSMYPFDLSHTAADADKIAAAVHAFMDGGYEHQAPHVVPKESGWMDLVWEAAQSLKVSPTPMLWVGIILLAIGGIGFLIFVGAGIWYMYAPDKPAAKKQDTAAADKKDAGSSGAAADAAAEDVADVAQESSDSKPTATRATRRRAA